MSEIQDLNMSKSKLSLTGSKAIGDKLVVWEERTVEKWKAKDRVWGGDVCTDMRKRREV